MQLRGFKRTGGFVALGGGVAGMAIGVMGLYLTGATGIGAVLSAGALIAGGVVTLAGAAITWYAIQDEQRNSRNAWEKYDELFRSEYNVTSIYGHYLPFQPLR